MEFVIVGGILVITSVLIVWLYYFKEPKMNLKTRPILVYEGNIMSLEQYKMIRNNKIRKNNDTSRTTNESTTNDNKK